jgi:hypothetical protein
MKQIIGHPLLLLALGAIILAYAPAIFNRVDILAKQAAAIARAEAMHRANQFPTER